MSSDIAKALYRKLAINGIVFTPEVFRTIKASYYRAALDLVDHYHNDAVLNGLTLDRHREEATVELFAQSIVRAGERFLSNPMETPFMPSWSRVESAVPGIFERMLEAVEGDNRPTT
jgi:glucosyl-3-phosphoglycerate synthase